MDSNASSYTGTRFRARERGISVPSPREAGTGENQGNRSVCGGVPKAESGRVRPVVRGTSHPGAVSLDFASGATATSLARDWTAIRIPGVGVSRPYQRGQREPWAEETMCSPVTTTTATAGSRTRKRADTGLRRCLNRTPRTGTCVMGTGSCASKLKRSGGRQYTLFGVGLDDPAPSSRPPASAIGAKGVLGSDPEGGVRKVEVVYLAGTGRASIAPFAPELARNPERVVARRSSRDVPSINADNPTCNQRGPPSYGLNRRRRLSAAARWSSANRGRSR